MSSDPWDELEKLAIPVEGPVNWCSECSIAIYDEDDISFDPETGSLLCNNCYNA